MQRKLVGNILKLYIIKSAKWFMLIMPIVALYYSDNGLEPFDIYLLQAIYSFSVAVFEIPSGYLGDIMGRKKSILIGSILGFSGYLVYSLSFDFTGFMIAEIILGLGGSFISGSDSALLYDTLADLRKRNKYLKLEGRISAVGNFAETSAALFGGLIAGFLSYRAVYVCQTMIAFIAIPAAIMLIEPSKLTQHIKPGLKQIIQISKYSLFENKKLSSSILFSSVIGTATLCMAWTAQVFFVEKGLNEQHITPLWIGLNLIVAVSSFWVENFVKQIGYKSTIYSIIIIIPLGYLWLGILPLWFAIASLFVFYLIRGFATPILKDMINTNCQSEVRATVLSIRSLIIRLLFSALGPLLGYITGIFDINTAMIFAFGIITLLLLPASFFYFWTLKR